MLLKQVKREAHVNPSPSKKQIQWVLYAEVSMLGIHMLSSNWFGGSGEINQSRYTIRVPHAFCLLAKAETGVSVLPALIAQSLLKHLHGYQRLPRLQNESPLVV